MDFSMSGSPLAFGADEPRLEIKKSANGGWFVTVYNVPERVDAKKVSEFFTKILPRVGTAIDGITQAEPGETWKGEGEAEDASAMLSDFLTSVAPKKRPTEIHVFTEMAKLHSFLDEVLK